MCSLISDVGNSYTGAVGGLCKSGTAGQSISTDSLENGLHAMFSHPIFNQKYFPPHP
jgi:hypothetical protein